MTLEQLGVVLGQTILIAAFALPLLFTFLYAKKYAVTFNKVALFFCLLTPLSTLSFMVGHLAGVILVNTDGILHHEKSYDYRMYSLLLMGIVFFGFGVYLLQKIKCYCKGEQHAGKDFIRASLFFAALSLPVGPFNFGGFFIGGASLVSCLSFIYIRQSVNKKKAVINSKEVEFAAPANSWV